MYKNLLSIFITLVLIPTITTGQNGRARQPASIGFDFILNDYRTLSSGERERIQRPHKPVSGVAASYTNGISGRYSWTIKLAGSFSDSLMRKSRVYPKQMLVETSVGIRRMFTDHGSRLQPFLSMGVGGAYHQGMLGCFIPAGAGVEVHIGKAIFTTLQAEYRAGVGSPFSSHLFYGVGIAGIIPSGTHFSKSRSSPTMPASTIPPHPIKESLVSSTADRDHDGIFDQKDECPDRPGRIDNRGCPVAPDTIRMEMAVATAVPAGQSVREEESLISISEQSATDNELAMTDDSTTVSFIANDSENKKKRTADSLAFRFELLAKKISFETNSYTIADISLPYLDEIANALLAHRHIGILIVGHTDDVGTAEKNLVLSRKRAQAVKEYLEMQGIPAKRLSAEGRGESQPMLQNRDEAGRAANRRVELHTRIL